MTYNFKNKRSKLKSYIWKRIVKKLKDKSYFPLIYRSYWYSKFNKQVKNLHANYFTAIPNQGAGIGHQLANWIAGYWFARQFGVQFAHTPFSNPKWEKFFGFGEDEISVAELVENKGYKKVLLPLFDESDKKQVKIIQDIINAHGGKKCVFVAEQDQFYKDQYGVIDDLQRKFYKAESRKNDQLIYSKSNFNIAIHIRRGDIVVNDTSKNENLKIRWQDNSYFINVLSDVISSLECQKPVFIYLFSQGNEEDFSEFKKFPNVNFCLQMGVQETFLHMVYADLLITSKSSFSYKPALLNKGIKICPADFWHGYPNSKDFILTDGETLPVDKILCNC